METVTLLGMRPGPARRPRPARRAGSGGDSGEPPVARPSDADAEVPWPKRCRWRCAGAPAARTAGCSARSRLTRRSHWSSSGWPPRPRPPGLRRGRPDAHRAARGGQPRPAHPAGLGQGRRDQPAPRRQWTPEEREELLATADESLDRLTRLVENLLDMSRLQAGALTVFPRPAGLDEVVATGPGRPRDAGGAVKVDIPDRCPRSGRTRPPGTGDREPDPNALRYSPAGHPAAARRERPRRPGGAAGGRPRAGHPRAHQERMFAPFQRLGDTDNTTGVGLGLALSRGLTEAMGGTLDPEETPGGGLTMSCRCPRCADSRRTWQAAA